MSSLQPLQHGMSKTSDEASTIALRGQIAVRAFVPSKVGFAEASEVLSALVNLVV